MNDVTATWTLVHAERAALAADLLDLTEEQWRATSLCTELSVREVLAHLTAGATLSFPRWFAGVLRHRFDFDAQVLMRLREQLGDSSAATLTRFRAAAGRSTTPLGRRGGPVFALAETVAHAEDIRRPLGIKRDYPAQVLTTVAEYYAGTDLTVPAQSRITGLRLVATDTEFSAGAGELVTGPTIALVMAMIGRGVCCEELEGEGVPTLRGRC
ncbi:maleylpyruvate isomerase family mycothiol-dependent enzyme [Kribbella sp. CA-293567]|uniref:maleylpyruvate isomerase family mycothiol-dependent enzyme n=1 Tax=Kribbella sp. CA-293567 TaxID=3002436 RepID=UPI0022DCF178|nr:maleylpyruvate isomerase family mycothiol-dependent enzyme [Kribbella sp. CA-293567]WBQ02163.1 maleylpyruvate isomerase family mycothiol-dependent enzyme [Kribbella sp. CA-293567]